MKIVLLSTTVLPTPPNGYGGSERVAWDLAEGLARHGHEVILVAHKDSRTPPGGRLEPWATVNLDAVLGEADIIHDHGWDLTGWRWAQRHPDRPVMMTWHGPNIGPVVGWQPPPDNLTVVGVSTFHARVLSGELGCPVRRVYNGIDLEAYPLWQGPRPDPPLVLARLDPAKGQHILVEMARATGHRLALAGTEHMIPDANYVRMVLHRLDGDRWQWYGDLGMEDKIYRLQRASRIVWVTPGYEEPFGLGLVEAMACGTPVVALNRGAVGEIVEQGGWLVGSLGDIPDYVWPDDPDDDRRGPEDCRDNAARFSAERMVQAYEKLYQFVLH